MITLGSLQYVTDALGAWFDRLGNRRLNLRQDERAAVSAYLKALNETELFLSQSDGCKGEAKLSRLWTGAADVVRRIDSDLAERCYQKGRYWANLSAWTQEDIDEAKIGISTMVQSAEELLR